jgi:hypothetical protein
MSDLRYPSWQETVLLAVMEFDPRKQREKINDALQAIEARRAELYGDADRHEECLALQDAVRTLTVVRRKDG